jgi:hypothetical protein
MSDTTPVISADTDVTVDATEIQPNPNRVWFRNDYSRAIVFVRTSRQARYGAPWDAKDNDMAGPSIDAVAALLASAFAQDNPFFNAESWLAATQLPAKPELPEGAFDASDDEGPDDGDVDELAALLDDSE